MKDPTKQARVRRKLIAKINRSLASARNSITRAVKGLYVNLAYTEYDVKPHDLEQMQGDIDRTINNELLGTYSGNSMPDDWAYAPEIEQPYRSGTAEAVNEHSRLVEAAIIAGLLKVFLTPPKISVQEVLLSAEYQAKARIVRLQAFSSLKGLSTATSNSVKQVIESGMSAGKSRSEIILDINDRFKVAKSRAKRIVNTEVSKAYNDAKIDAAKLIEKRTGQKTKVRHISALLPTTRESHEARHNHVYTREQQLAWWDTGVNRINCYCSTKTVLIDKKGNEINL